ncbi:MAG TPA: hypothetical protein VEY07_02410 [Thermoplasmata archaeon]|nr:hypothetical protein [Thermoplasmata archaeon]
MRANQQRAYLLVVAVGIAIATIVAVFATGTVPLAPPSAPPPPPPPPPPLVTLNATISAGPVVAHHLASPFFAVVLTASNLTFPQLVATGAYLNSTPVSWIRFGGGGEAYDPTTQTLYLPPTGGGQYTAVHEQLWNFSWFRSWCYSRTPHCDWLTYLPGQVNSSAYAVHYATWFHTVLNFVPTEWELSNEPELWDHFGKNFSRWSTTDALPPTGPGYGTMVQSYIAAVSARFPQDQYIGIEAACATCDHTLVPATAAEAGPYLAGMAYHSYPTLPGSSTDLATFYSTLVGPTALASTLGGFQSLYRNECASCSSLPTQIGEYQAGPPTGGFSPFAAQYPGAVFLGASVIQALESNLQSFTEFNVETLYSASTHTVTPEGILYQRILANMTMGNDLSVNVTSHGVSGMFAVLVHNGSRQSLLLVNSNLTTVLNLTIPTSGFPVGVTGSEWSWQPGETDPAVQRGVSLPQVYSVPPQGILLLDNF